MSDPLQQLENHPDFAKQTYESQTKMRSLVIRDMLMNNQEFMNLPDDRKALVFEKSVFRPPVFELNEIVEDPTNKQLIKNVQAGDILALRQAQLMVASDLLIESNTLFKLVTENISYPLVGLMYGKKPELLKRERGKLLEYLDYLTSKDKREAKVGNTMKTIFGLAGNIIDIGLYYQAGSLIGAKTGLTGKLLGGLDKLKDAGRLGPWITSISKSLLHGAAGGFVGVVRENLKDLLNGGFEDPSFGEVALNSMKYFGEYALGDIAFFALGGIFNTLRRGLKWSFRGNWWTPTTDKEVLQLMDDALSLRTIDNALYSRLPPKIQSIVSNLQSFSKTAKNVEKLDEQQLFQVIAMSNGYTMSQNITDRTFNMTNLIDDATGTFKTFDEAVDWFIKDFKKTTDIKLNAGNAKIAAHGSGKIQISNVISEGLPEGTVNDDVLTRVIAPKNNRVTGPQIGTFTRGYLKYNDIDAVINVLKEGDDFILKVDGGEIAKVNSIILNPGDETKMIKSITDGLSDIISKGKKTSKLGDDFLAAYKKSLKKQSIYTPEWTKMVIEEKLGGSIEWRPGGKYMLNVPGKEPVLFPDFDSVGNFIARDLLDINMLKSHLKYNEGLSLVETQKKELHLKKGSKLIGRFKDVQTLLEKFPELSPKVSSTYGPDFTFVDDTISGIKYRKTVAIGSQHDILRHLAGFKNTSDDAYLSMITGDSKKKITHNRMSNKYEVYIPDVEFRETFDSFKDAKNFISEGIDDWTSLDYIATKKGYRLDTSAGQFVLYTEGGRQFVAKTKDELKRILRNAPMPEWAPELSGLDAEIIRNFETIPEFQHKPMDFTTVNSDPKLMSPGWIAGNAFRPPGTQFENMVKAGGPVELLKSFRAIENVRAFARGQNSNMLEVLEGLFKNPKGKVFKKIERVGIGELLENAESSWDDIAKRFDLGPEHLEAAKNLRAFLGETAEEGLFKYMNVDARRFLENYLPRLRKYSSELDNFKRYNDGSTSAFINDALGGNIPNADVFFKHARLSDFVNFVREKDPLVLLSKYITLGNKERFIGPVIDEISSFLKKNGSKIDPQVLKRFTIYMEEAVGLPQTYGLNAVKSFTERFHKNIASLMKRSKFKFLKDGGKHLEESTVKSLISTVTGWGYLSTMAFRVWMPIRNMWQVWTTLAPRIGNTYVDDALKMMTKDMDGALHRNLLNKGIIGGTLPIAGGEFLEGGTKLDLLLSKGLRHFRGSDEFTRAVAYIASEKRFNDAFKLLKDGSITNKKFINMSGIYNLSDDLLDSAMNFIKQGNKSAASDLFATEMVTQTMFPYRAGMSPTSFRGVIGKLFGQMGHYPLYYVDNLRRGIFGKNSTIGNRVAFGATLALNSATLYYTFKEVFGVNANNFLPWMPTMFSGGPYYDLMNTVLDTMNAGYKGREARAKLAGIKEKDGQPYFDIEAFGKSEIATLLAPGSLALRGFMKGLEHLNSGDYYKAFLSIGSFPIVPEK